MTVIDVDSHYEPDVTDLDHHPLRELGAQLPSLVDMALAALAGDLWQSTPPALRDDLKRDIPLLQGLDEKAAPADTMMAAALDRPPAADDAAARVQWMNDVGIDVALVNPGGYSAAVALPPPRFVDHTDRHHAMRLCNDYLADWVDGHAHRLAPVSIVDVDDLDWSVGELERMRARGSRAAFVWATPFEGRSPGHPEHDRFWQALSALGMVAILHIGQTPARFDGGWADGGWTRPGGSGAGGYLRFANSARLEAAQKFVSALVFSGTFSRVPNATILLSELWASWLPWWIERFDMLADETGLLGPWSGAVAPEVSVRRNVKATPLPGLRDDGMAAIDQLPEMLVFSSDFPHGEGNIDPMGAYGHALDALAPDVRAAFLGGTMAEVFARMGDPLVPKVAAK